MDHNAGRKIAGRVIEAVPSFLFSAVVYGVPIVYTAGIVAEFVFSTFFKQTRPSMRPKATEDKYAEASQARSNNSK